MLSLNLVPILTQFRLRFRKYEIQTGSAERPDLSFGQIFAADLCRIASGTDPIPDSESFDLQDKDLIAVFVKSNELTIQRGDTLLSAQKSIQFCCIHAADRDGEFRKGEIDLIDRLSDALDSDLIMVCDQNIGAAGIKVIIHDKLP